MNDDSGVGALTAQEIDEIPQLQITSKQTEKCMICSVCLDHFKQEEAARILPCNHLFHDLCIVPWLQLRGNCPDCRRPLVSDVEDGYLSEETWSGYESTHSTSDFLTINDSSDSHLADSTGEYTPRSVRTTRIVESVNGAIYIEELELDETMSSDVELTLSAPSISSYSSSILSDPVLDLSEDSDSDRPSPPKTRRLSPPSGNSSLLTPTIYSISDDDDMSNDEDDVGRLFGNCSVSDASSDSLAETMLSDFTGSVSVPSTVDFTQDDDL